MTQNGEMQVALKAVCFSAYQPPLFLHSSRPLLISLPHLSVLDSKIQLPRGIYLSTAALGRGAAA